MVYGKKISIKTKGYSDIKNITDEVYSVAQESNISDGMVLIHAIGSTASISTIEFEPALNKDFQDQLEEFIAHNKPTRHGDTWGDDNGFSHIRATFMGPSITVPLSNNSLVLGTWQQIIVLDHDNRPRNREIFVQVMGE